jgi:hypothetical protein
MVKNTNRLSMLKEDSSKYAVKKEIAASYPLLHAMTPLKTKAKKTQKRQAFLAEILSNSRKSKKRASKIPK